MAMAQPSEPSRGHILRLHRERARKKLREVAAHLGVSLQTVSNWELDKQHPSRENLEKLADYYNVSMDVLTQRIIDHSMITDPPEAAGLPAAAVAALLTEAFRAGAEAQTVARAAELLQELQLEAREPPDPEINVSDLDQLRIRLRRVLRRFAREAP